MKRDSVSLLKEAAEADADAQLRRRLQRQADADERSQRLRELTALQLAKFGEHITNWNNTGVIVGTDYSVSEPTPIPLGTPWCESPPLPVPPRLPSPDLVLGARIDTALVSRKNTRLEYLRAMLPDEALVALSHAINSLVLTTKSPNAVHKFKATTKADIWRWIGQRLDITLNVKLQLKEAYKSVSISRRTLVIESTHFTP
jgi:hypothetical protein